MQTLEDLILLPDTFFKDLEYKHLLLDTCFFIDSLDHFDAVYSFCKNCREHNITLASIEPVAIEFTKGQSSLERIKERLELMELLIDCYLPLTKEVISKLQVLVQSYGKMGNKASMTDLLIGATAVNYCNGLYIATKNITDFPHDTFNLEQHFLLKNKVTRTVQMYGVYCFEKEEKI